MNKRLIPQADAYQGKGLSYAFEYRRGGDANVGRHYHKFPIFSWVEYQSLWESKKMTNEYKLLFGLLPTPFRPMTRQNQHKLTPHISTLFHYAQLSVKHSSRWGNVCSGHMLRDNTTCVKSIYSKQHLIHYQNINDRNRFWKKISNIFMHVFYFAADNSYPPTVYREWRLSWSYSLVYFHSRTKALIPTQVEPSQLN